MQNDNRLVALGDLRLTSEPQFLGKGRINNYAIEYEFTLSQGNVETRRYIEVANGAKVDIGEIVYLLTVSKHFIITAFEFGTRWFGLRAEITDEMLQTRRLYYVAPFDAEVWGSFESHAAAIEYLQRLTATASDADAPAKGLLNNGS